MVYLVLYPCLSICACDRVSSSLSVCLRQRLSVLTCLCCVSVSDLCLCMCLFPHLCISAWVRACLPASPSLSVSLYLSLSFVWLSVRVCLNNRIFVCLQVTGIQNSAFDHPEGTQGWQCVQFSILGSSFLPYKNPHKRTCAIKGDPAAGNFNPCIDITRSKAGGTELAPMQGPAVVAELVDTVLDAWYQLGFSTSYPSNPFAIMFQGFAPGLCFTGGCTEGVTSWKETFVKNLMVVLGPRHSNQIWIEMLDGPEPCPITSGSGLIGQLTGAECPSVQCFDSRVCESPWARNPFRNRRDGAESYAERAESTGEFSISITACFFVFFACLFQICSARRRT